MDEKMEIQALRTQLYHAYITQDMVAKHVGVHKSYVSKVFNGKVYSEKIIKGAKELLSQRAKFIN